MTDDVSEVGRPKPGRPTVDATTDSAVNDYMMGRVKWLEDALSRMRGEPDIDDAERVLGALGEADSRRQLVDGLLAHVVPTSPDLEAWAKWASTGASPARESWMRPDRSVGRVRPQQGFDRAIGAERRHLDAAAALRKEAAELLKDAEAAEQAALNSAEQARVFLVMLLDTALQRAISPAYSMGAGWVVLKSIATTSNGRKLLGQLDAFGIDGAFVEAFGKSIEGFVTSWAAQAVSQPPHRHSGVDGSAGGHWSTLPQGVGVGEVRQVLALLVKGASSDGDVGANTDHLGDDVVPYERVNDIVNSEPLPFAAEDYSAMDVLHQDADETGHNVEEVLEQRVTMATPLVHGKAKPARSKALSAGGEDASLFTAPLPVVLGIEADSADGDDDDRIPGF